MDRRVTPPKRVTLPTWGPPPPCKQALNLYSIYNPNDQRTFFNTMECDHRGKGEGKGTILRYFIFLDGRLS